MLFNTPQFALFFIIVYSLYLALNHRWQNRLLLISSYFFYGAWDWRFLSLIIVSTTVDYICAIKINETDERRRKKLFLLCSLFCNLSILGFFKYFNFFIANFQSLLGLFGITVQPLFLHIVLPVGISFYTFKTLSYTIDVYRSDMRPTNKIIDYALFVSFFPQILAGPIDRARAFLPQIASPRIVTLDKFYEGSYLIFWGLFQKVFIADNLASLVDPFFASRPPYCGTNVILAAIAFAFQVYCDFAGYSNMARGLGKCMGFDMIINFNLPFFATNTGEFWRRWHISLSDWFRDYLYTPMVINRRQWGMLGILFSLLISFMLIGLWHGAQWTFIIFGFLQGGILCVEALTKRSRKKLSRIMPDYITGGFGMVFTFCYFCFTCVFFRAQNVSEAFDMITSLALHFSFQSQAGEIIRNMLFYTWPLIIIQLLQYRKGDLLAVLSLPVRARALIYFVMYYLLVVYGVEGGKEFIYFKF
jgi:alginate O-acetyltransferase complex protein AlgI